MKPNGQMVTLDGDLMDTGNGHLMEPDGQMKTKERRHNGHLELPLNDKPLTWMP